MRRPITFIWKIPNILWYKNFFFVAYVIIINPTNPPIIDGNSGPNNIPDNPYGIVKLNAAKIENLKIDNPSVQDLLLRKILSLS